MSIFNLLIILAITAVMLYVGIYQAADLPPTEALPGGLITTVLSTIFVVIVIRVTHSAFSTLVSKSADTGSDIVERIGNRIIGGKWE